MGTIGIARYPLRKRRFIGEQQMPHQFFRWLSVCFRRQLFKLRDTRLIVRQGNQVMHLRLMG